MTSKSRLMPLFLLAFMLTSLPAKATAQPGASMITELAAMLTGEFDSRKQMEEDKANAVAKDQFHGRVNRAFLKMEEPDFDRPVLVGSTLYGTTKWIFDENEFLVWTFEAIEDGKTIVATPRRFKDQQRRLPFARDAERLSGFSPGDLEPARSGASCQIYWTRAEGGFSGQTRNCRAMSTVHKKMMTWDWRYQLRGDAMMVDFSGTDEQGKVLDRTPEGNPYRLDRIGAPYIATSRQPDETNPMPS